MAPQSRLLNSLYIRQSGSAPDGSRPTVDIGGIIAIIFGGIAFLCCIAFLVYWYIRCRQLAKRDKQMKDVAMARAMQRNEPTDAADAANSTEPFDANVEEPQPLMAQENNRPSFVQEEYVPFRADPPADGNPGISFTAPSLSSRSMSRASNRTDRPRTSANSRAVTPPPVRPFSLHLLSAAAVTEDRLENENEDIGSTPVPPRRSSKRLKYQPMSHAKSDALSTQPLLEKGTYQSRKPGSLRVDTARFFAPVSRYNSSTASLFTPTPTQSLLQPQGPSEKHRPTSTVIGLTPHPTRARPSPNPTGYPASSPRVPSPSLQPAPSTTHTHSRHRALSTTSLTPFSPLPSPSARSPTTPPMRTIYANNEPIPRLSSRQTSRRRRRPRIRALSGAPIDLPTGEVADARRRSSMSDAQAPEEGRVAYRGLELWMG